MSMTGRGRRSDGGGARAQCGGVEAEGVDNAAGTSGEVGEAGLVDGDGCQRCMMRTWRRAARISPESCPEAGAQLLEQLWRWRCCTG